MGVKGGTRGSATGGWAMSPSRHHATPWSALFAKYVELVSLQCRAIVELRPDGPHHRDGCCVIRSRVAVAYCKLLEAWIPLL